MIFIGYEIRERFGNDSMSPIPDYPLGVNTITMDTGLCRPCNDSACKVSGYPIFLLPSFGEAEAKFRSIRNWTPFLGQKNKNMGSCDYSIFAYFVDDDAISKLKEMERLLFGSKFIHFNKHPIIEETIPQSFKKLGYDVVRGLSQFDRWESELANEGIPRDELEKHGPLNTVGLYSTYEDALGLVRELRSFSGSADADIPFVVMIMALNIVTASGALFQIL